MNESEGIKVSQGGGNGNGGTVSRIGLYIYIWYQGWDLYIYCATCLLLVITREED